MPHNNADGNTVDDRLLFFKQLQAISNRIHAAPNVEKIMVEMSREICNQFDCDRLTLYAISDKKTSIDSKVKTGLKSFKDFSLPISENSIAGFVALSKKTVNIGNVYDEAELKAYSPGLQFLKKVDMRTGYRTQQMLTAPILHSETGELLGVLQLINTRSGGQFAEMMTEGIAEICETLAVAFANRMQPPLVIQTKYDHLVAEAILSMPELDLAARAARRKGMHIEQVLVEEFQVKLSELGESLAKFFGVYYESYLPGRIKPDALKNFKRSYVEHNHWLVLEEDADGLLIMSTDPDRIMGSRVIQNFFPKINVEYCVTTHGEFIQTVEQFFGTDAPENTQTHDAEIAEDFDIDTVTLTENTLADRVNEAVAFAFSQHAPDIRIEPRMRPEKTVTRLRKNGSVQSISGQIVIDFSLDYADDDAADSQS